LETGLGADGIGYRRSGTDPLVTLPVGRERAVNVRKLPQAERDIGSTNERSEPLQGLLRVVIYELLRSA